jgi:hypothetical protein
MQVRRERDEMGEKGNLLDMSEEVFANLAEQGPQFWLSYKQYMDSRDKGDQASRVTVEHQAATVVAGPARTQQTPDRPSPSSGH